MLRAIPQSFFSQHFRLMRDGEEVALLKTSNWKNRANLKIDGKEVHLFREKTFSGRFLLELDGNVLATATKPSAFRNRFELNLGEQPCEIRKKGASGKVFMVMSGERVLGQVAREGWFTRKAVIDLPEDWPVVLQVFVFWLVLVLWRRAEAAAGASGA